MQINIDLDYLLNFLNKIYVWSPKGSYIRGELETFINQLKQYKQK